MRGMSIGLMVRIAVLAVIAVCAAAWAVFQAACAGEARDGGGEREIPAPEVIPIGDESVGGH